MKKIIKLLFVLFTSVVSSTMVSCDGMSLNSNKGISSIDIVNNEIIDRYKNLSSLAFISSLSVDNVETVSKQSYFSYVNNDLKGYSLINRETSKLVSNKSVVKEYVSNSMVYYLDDDKNGYLKEFNSEGIMSYIGFSSILNSINGNVAGSSVDGVIGASSVSGLVRSIIYECGFYDDNYENYYFNSNISYSIAFNWEDKSIISIDLDVTSVVKLKDYSVNKATSRFVFFLDEDVESVLNGNPFPEIDSGNNDNNSYEAIIKAKGVDYINDCYEDIEYVSDDLYLYPNCIISPRLSFSYESSNQDVFSNDGKYKSVSSDVVVTLTVHLKYAGVEYTKLVFDFLVVPKSVNGNGTLGSISNPIYKGRKEIDEIKINFLEMHQQYGDAIYIQAGDFDMLIDAGTSLDGAYVNDFLRRNVSDGRIEMVVATHAHSDHIGGMESALSTFPNITYAVDYGYTISDYSLVGNVRNRFNEADNYYPITDCIDNLNGARDVIYVTNDLYISFLDTGYYLSPSKDCTDDNFDANQTSVALMVTFKNQNYYFAGDLTRAPEKNLLNKGLIKKVSVAKASHHGSTTSNCTEILSKLNPNVSVISTALVSRGSSTKNAENQTHPIGSALANLISYSKKVYCNFTMGTVQVACDGSSKVDVKGLGLSSPYYMDGKEVTGEENLEFKYTKYAKKYRLNYI